MSPVFCKKKTNDRYNYTTLGLNSSPRPQVLICRVWKILQFRIVLSEFERKILIHIVMRLLQGTNSSLRKHSLCENRLLPRCWVALFSWFMYLNARRKLCRTREVLSRGLILIRKLYLCAAELILVLLSHLRNFKQAREKSNAKNLLISYTLRLRKTLKVSTYTLALIFVNRLT